MGNLFGIRRRAPQVTPQDRTILQLKQQRDKIKIYQKRTESELARNAELALKLFQSNMKDRAIIVLRRKKMMEDILSRTDKQLELLEQMVGDIEYTQIEVSVVEGLKVGTEALKQLTSLMNIDDIQQMMEDTAEAADKQREISAILQQSSERYDEEDLLNELETYQKEATPTAGEALDQLPSVPENIKVVQQESEEVVELEPEPEPEAEPEEKSEKEEKESIRPKERRKILVDSS